MATRKAIQITLRLYEEDAQRIDEIAKGMSGPGIAATTADAVRYVLQRGYAPAERELGIAKAAEPKLARGKATK